MTAVPPHPPVEPPATRAVFSDPRRADCRGILAVDDDLSPGTLLSAYRVGIFWEYALPNRRPALGTRLGALLRANRPPRRTYSRDDGEP